MTAQYRLIKNVHLAGEISYWYPRIDRRTGGTSQDTFQEPKECDGFLNIGGGLRVNVMGSDFSTDRLYAKGIFGFADYLANDRNQEKANRYGYYINLGGGIEHSFVKKLSVYADGVYHWASLSSDNDIESTLDAWAITGGFPFHWGKKNED